MSRSSIPLPPGGDDGHRGVVGEDTENAEDISRYVADICGELSKMTQSARLMMLTYLLGMARMEAERIARGQSPAK